jgi:hypothetical protein
VALSSELELVGDNLEIQKTRLGEGYASVSLHLTTLAERCPPFLFIRWWKNRSFESAESGPRELPSM